MLRDDAGRAHDHYAWMLNEDDADPARQGLARELARMNLTLNTYTQWYWKTDLHNLLGFLSLRADPHAQYEIRAYADAMLATVEAWVPDVLAAFRDYRLGAVDVVRRDARGGAPSPGRRGGGPGEQRPGQARVGRAGGRPDGVDHHTRRLRHRLFRAIRTYASAPIDAIAPVVNEAAARLRSSSFPAFSPRDLVTALFYYKRVVLAAFTIPCILGVIAGMLAHTSYVAQARLLVLYGSEYVFHPGNRDTGNDITLDRNQIIQGELQILQSPALASEVLAEIGPAVVYPGLPEGDAALRTAVSRLAQDLTVSSIPQSNVLELSLRNPARVVAVRVLQAMIAHYLTYRVGIFDKAQQSPGLDTQRDQFADRLRQAEEALAQFGIVHGISNLDEQISQQIRQKAETVNQQSVVGQQIGETAARVTALHRELASVPATVQMFAESARSQQSTGLTDSLARLQIQRRDLAARYQDDFPLVRDVDRQIAAVRGQIGADPAREGNITRMGRNLVYDDLHREEITLSAQLQGLQAKKAKLDADATGQQARTDELAGVARQYRDLQRTRDVLDQSYRAISRSSEETALSDAQERARGANVRVVQPPDAPLGGRNQRSLLFAGGAVLGVLAAIAAFTLLNATRQVFVGVRDVERQLDLPVLLAVPLASARRRKAGRQNGARGEAGGEARRPAARPSFGV